MKVVCGIGPTEPRHEANGLVPGIPRFPASSQARCAPTLATWYQLVSRIRDIAEHALASEDDDPLRNTRTVLAGFLARTFVAPYWVNYHLEHHLLVFVPCWKLRQAHALLVAKGYRPRMEIAPSYVSVIRRATSSRDAPRSGSRSGRRPA